MADWQTLLASNMEQEIARKRANPGVANFSTLVNTALGLGIKRKETAMQAAYQQYPEAAAADAGVTIPPKQPISAEGPAGTQLTKVQYDERGNPTTVYENPATMGGGPSWGQAQKVEALKTGLRMGKVIIGREFGEPSVYPENIGEIMTMEHALRAIQDAGLDPALFSEELKLYDVVEERSWPPNKKDGRIMQKLRDGRTIWKDNKESVS